MGKRFRVEEPKSTQLTWEETHPTDYLYGPSEKDLKWLKRKIKKDEKSISKATKQQKNE